MRPRLTCASPPPPRAREALKQTSRPGGRTHLLHSLLPFFCLAFAGLLPMAAGAQMGAPTVSGVAIDPINRLSVTAHSASVFGDNTISVSVSFSEVATVTGTPRLALTIGTQTR